MRTGGLWVWRGLLAVHLWFVLGAPATLGGSGSGRGVTELVIPVAVVVLLFRSGPRAWFGLRLEQLVERRPFSVSR
ncbi:hypothetical protein ACFRFL_38850 [Streptomyces sp. NPDC056708]|uniref:hypothetical protein n=1 Tax=unclassified Streptomyces TaxID=2593676 RepID=UPI0036B22F5F